ncbi:MAG TPA: hypothetical protein VF658_01185 [Pyrinomonadaceae bacterium]
MLCLFAAMTMLLCGAQPRAVMAQATTTTTNITLPLNMTVIACEGQQVTLNGNIHITTHVTTNASGGVLIKEHSNYQNVSGVGQPTPFLYRGVSSNNTTYNNSLPQSEFTVVDQVLLLSQGLSDNLQVHVTMHFTINANGQTTAVIEEVRVECNG